MRYVICNQRFCKAGQTIKLKLFFGNFYFDKNSRTLFFNSFIATFYMIEYFHRILINNIKLAFIISTFILAGCSSSININDYIDKNSPFDLTINSRDTVTGFTKSIKTKITVNSDKYSMLINWLANNKNGWQTTPASYAVNVLVTQNSFRLLCNKGGKGVVIGFADKQYSKSTKQGELDFLFGK